MRRIQYVFILSVFIGSIGTIATVLYLPSLPAITKSLHTTINMSQFSITTFVLGFSIARLLLATVSDVLGRKKPLLVGLLACLIGSILCVFAKNIYMLYFGRLLQGFGAGGSNVLSRIILRDIVQNGKLAKYLSYYSMVGISAMAGAPLFGGYLQQYFGWHASFEVIFLYSVIALILVIFTLPETSSYKVINSFKLSIIWKYYWSLFTNYKFMVYALFLMIGYGCMIAWLTVSPVILQKVILLNPIEYGWCVALVGSVYFIGAYINSRMVIKYGIERMLKFGINIFFFAGIIILFFMLVHNNGLISLLVPIMIAIFGISLIIPNSFAAGLTLFAETAGIAVAILASIQILGGVISSSIISLVSSDNQLLINIIMIFGSMICVMLFRRLQKYKSNN